MVTTLSAAPTKPTFSPPPPTLDEDSIDDLLYFSRAAELSDLETSISELSKSLNRYALEIAAAAVDPYSGNTCLHMAAANNHVEVVNYILRLELPPVGTPAAHPETELLAAVQPVVQATASETEQSSSIPSFPSVPSKYLESLLNFPNASGNTPLHWACLNGHIGAVKALMQAGADPSILNAAGHDAVYEAEVNDKSDVVEWVLNFAEGLENGVGILGEGEDDEKEPKNQQKEIDNADVLRDEGRKHEERQADAVEGGVEGKSDSATLAGVAIDKLELGEKEPTIR
ncbi:Ankycorbin [Dactylella cylindrospora]|nr:Ankycorbin [Dactylella cylindrospora]